MGRECLVLPGGCLWILPSTLNQQGKCSIVVANSPWDTGNLWLNTVAMPCKWWLRWGVDCGEQGFSILYIQTLDGEWGTPRGEKNGYVTSQPHLPQLWRSNSPLLFAGLTYQVSKYLKVINQINKPLKHVLSSYLDMSNSVTMWKARLGFTVLGVLGSLLEQGGTRRGEPLPQKATEVQIPTLILRLLSRYLSRQRSCDHPEPRSPHLGRPLLEAGTWNDA